MVYDEALQLFGQIQRVTMRRILPLLTVVGALSACSDSPISPLTSPDIAPSMSVTGGGTCIALKGGVMTEVSKGFDNLGYNRCARIFNGPADGADGKLDGMFGGYATYAPDHLKMKWNAEWERGNLTGWTDPSGYAGAWTDNQWNGQVPGGSGETWHYKIKWIGPCGGYGALTGTGGYCIWNQFEVTFSHGTAANEHFWDAHAKPAGYGN